MRIAKRTNLTNLVRITTLISPRCDGGCMETVTVNIHEAKAKLSALIARVEKGDRVRIARRGVVVAQLSALAPSAEDALACFDALRGRDQGARRSLADVDAAIAKGRP